MKCIIGLGNPESKYLNTKHNFGFWVIDKLIEERSLKYKAGKGDYVCAIDKQHMFVKPTTFVNNSGVAIQQMLKAYNNLNIKDIIVIYDDININLGNIRFKSSGTDGGHNGIKSIIYQLQIDIFDRLKIGIATDTTMRPLEEYVLKPFPNQYKKLVSDVINHAASGINYYLQHNINRSMNKYNKKDDNDG